MKNARPQTTEASALDKRNNTSAQLHLDGIEPAPLAVTWPQPNTHAAMALTRMLAGERLTQPSYGWHGWRLAAYVKSLEYLGWPVERADVPPPPGFEGTRPIRLYWLHGSVIRQAFEMRRREP